MLNSDLETIYNASLRKNTLDATRAPLPTDDASQGYAPGSRWLWQGQEWIATDVASGAAHWMRTQQITPQMFGAVGDGVVDDSAAVQAWADVGGGVLPAGRYRLMSAIHFPRPVAVRGAGMGVTVLDWPAGAASRGITITAGADTRPTTVESLTLLTGGDGDGTALLIDYSGNIGVPGVVMPRTAPRVRLRDIHMAGSGSVTNTGWLHHADIVDGVGVRISGCVVEGRGSGGTVVSQTGYRFRGGGSPVEITIDGCWAFHVADAVATDSVEGVIVTGSHFVAVNRGVAFTGAGTEPQCNVSDTHINAYVACVDLDQCAQANIHDNLLYSRNEITSEVIGVSVSSTCQNGRISRNTFVRTGTSTMRAVQVGGSDITVEDNAFHVVTVGIDILASAARTVERDNRFVGAVTTRLVDASATTIRGSLQMGYAGSLNDLAGAATSGATEAAPGGSASNIPTGASGPGSFVQTRVFDANAAHQEYADFASGDHFIRQKKAGVWLPWRRMTSLPADGPRDLSGMGSPEGVAAAPVGSTFRRTDGGAGTTLYVKESGTGNTGWVAK